MANLKLASLKFGVALFLSAVVAPAMCAQTPQQLQVEVGPNQEIRILASDVSYGEVLRALQKKLGWEIEIPPLADELKLSYVRVETTEPPVALAKLLEGSRLGYALLAEVNKFPTVKAVVIPLTPREASITHDAASTSSPISDNARAGVSTPLPAQAQAVTTSELRATGAETSPEPPEATPTMPLSEAINAIGVPPEVAPSDVGKTMTIPISEAARVMGVSSGMSPNDVGKTTTLPLPTGPGKHP